MPNSVHNEHMEKHSRVGKCVRLPSLKIPSDPPKFRFKRKTIILGPIESSTKCPEGSEVGVPNSDAEASDTVKEPENIDTLPPSAIKIERQLLPPLCGVPTCAGVVPDGYGGGAHLCGAITTSKPKVLMDQEGNTIKPKDNKSKHSAYGPNNWMQLLVSGQLPPHALEAFMLRFAETSNKRIQRDMDFAYKGPPIVRSKELWEPKKTPPPIGSAIDMSILEAKFRQQARIKSLSKKYKQQAQRSENVLLKKADTQDKRLKSYLNKLEQRTKEKVARTQNNTNNSKVYDGNRVRESQGGTNLQPVWEGIKRKLLKLPPLQSKRTNLVCGNKFGVKINNKKLQGKQSTDGQDQGVDPMSSHSEYDLHLPKF